MADTPQNDQRAAASAQGSTADNRLARASAAGPRIDQPADNQAAQDWTNAANADLDRFMDTHVRNSALAQRTDLYNDAYGHVRALKELFANFNAGR
jgi:hypothetical protein